MRRAKARGCLMYLRQKKKSSDPSLLLHAPKQAPWIIRFHEGSASVGLLTDAFRRSRQRAHSAFSPRHYSSSNDPLSRRTFPYANRRFAITATKPTRRRPGPCSGLSPDSLVQLNKNACPASDAGSRICHKSRLLSAESRFPRGRRQSLLFCHCTP